MSDKMRMTPAMKKAASLARNSLNRTLYRCKGGYWVRSKTHRRSDGGMYDSVVRNGPWTSTRTLERLVAAGLGEYQGPAKGPNARFVLLDHEEAETP